MRVYIIRGVEGVGVCHLLFILAWDYSPFLLHISSDERREVPFELDLSFDFLGYFELNAEGQQQSDHDEAYPNQQQE